MNRSSYSAIERTESVSRVTLWAFAALLLTSIHHAYGAYVFETPWRLHVLLVSLPAAAVIGAARLLADPHRKRAVGGVALAVLIAVTVIVPVIGVGLFEGAYNHVMKNAFYFGGASRELMNQLFPPPTYELPSDVFFEISGMMQTVPGTLAGLSLLRLFRAAPVAAPPDVARRQEARA